MTYIQKQTIHDLMCMYEKYMFTAHISANKEYDFIISDYIKYSNINKREPEFYRNNAINKLKKLIDNIKCGSFNTSYTQTTNTKSMFNDNKLHPKNINIGLSGLSDLTLLFINILNLMKVLQ